MSDPNYEKPTTQPFDVVMLKLGVSEQTCKPDDFKRVPVMAVDQLNAINDPKVEAAEKEYRVLGAVPPGHQTEIEMSARSRAYNGGEIDKAKIGF